MNLKNRNISLTFYNYLCDIIGSEEVVMTRRDIFTVKDIVDNTTGISFISSGSKAEGLDLKGSDFDLMILHNGVRVYQSLNDDQFNPDTIPLVMVTNDTIPGFTKIKLVSKSYLDTDVIHDWSETVGEETYISSKRFREYHLRDDMVIHGPCQSTSDGEYDHAKCFRCKEWITPAQQWIYRSRTAWPDYKTVTLAVQYGVLFVPIGSTNSLNEDLQWRVSFSVTEKLLIHSFSHTQLLCYALLKIILKDIIKPRHGDLLCSYFMKTIMLWLSEEVSPIEWKAESVISCFLDCLRRLVYCVQYKTCLHYFIPDHNFFEDRFTDSEHKTLLDTLQDIYKSPWTSIFHTATFQDFRLETVNSLGVSLTVSELSCFKYMNTLDESPNSFYSVCKRLVNSSSYSLNREMCIYMISVHCRDFIQTSDLCNLSNRNKSAYRQYQTFLGCLKIIWHSDSISSWLLLASLFYKYKRFQECTDVINYSLSNCTPDKIQLQFVNSLAEQTIYNEMNKKFGLLVVHKHLIFERILFWHPFNLLPNELKSLINDDVLPFPPVVYSHLLKFLCFYQLGDNKGKVNALRDLEITVRKRYFILESDAIINIAEKSVEIVKGYI
ncbi:uncharacterized protein LOC134690057 [Mytilus trossulus]|uniref:uncharacterized protein LOC134690057 n=1 Tax=Mytilus trossulus TaxID=6551 RepID=UPI003007D07A